jgi:hypothetical protein
MNGMEFTWRMATVLAWPLLLLVALAIFRKSISSSFRAALEGARVKRVKAGPAGIEVELETTTGAAGRDLGSALARLPRPAVEGPVPTSLVDLIDEVNKDARAGMRTAFDLVRRALAESYPQLAAAGPDQLVPAMRELARHGELSAEVELPVSQLYELYRMSESYAGADQAQGYNFLMLAEGAIHVILRSVQHAGISARWSGLYNNDYPIVLQILKWSDGEFTGQMAYPRSGTVTSITGQVKKAADRGDPTSLTWRETNLIKTGSRDPELNGRYEATVTGDVMSGEWYYDNSQRVVAKFIMNAAAD